MFCLRIYLVIFLLELASGFLLDNNGSTAIPNICKDAQQNCDLLNQTLNVCHDVHNGELLCKHYCGFCDVGHGGWSIWGSWGQCDVSCGNGTRMRRRQCDNPAPKNGGDDCLGESTEQIMCLVNPCPVHGSWGGWSLWGSCSVTCGVGLRRRDRNCDSPYPSKDGNHCFGDGINYDICTGPSCSVHGGWGGWSAWGSCSVTCGVGLRKRDRNCDSPYPAIDGNYCIGDGINHEICAGPSCSAWGTWSSWSSCSNTCGQGLMQRSRDCTGVTGTSPNMCVGEPLQYKTCKTSCSAHYNATTSAFAAHNLVQTTSSSLLFRSTFLNEGSDYNPSTGIFTCRIPGIYFFAVTLTKKRESGVDSVLSYIQFTGGSLYMHVDPYDDPKTDNGNYIMSSSTTLKLKRSDTVRIGLGSAANKFDANTASFTGFLLRADAD